MHLQRPPEAGKRSRSLRFRLRSHAFALTHSLTRYPRLRRLLPPLLSSPLLSTSSPLHLLQSIKSLANHCVDCRFRRPSPLDIKRALKRVIASEGYGQVQLYL